jgi:hypothetical protein
MKKTLLIVAAVAMVFGAAFTASAASTVSVTLTSPTVTEAPNACEKGGAVTFSFPAGSVLAAGDWWYMDLPTGATLCKDIDYLIIGDAVAGGTQDHEVWTLTTDPTQVTFLHNTDAIGGGNGTNLTPANDTQGPITTEAVTTGANVAVTGNLAIHVIGQAGSRRVTLYVAGDDPVVNNAHTNPGTLTVQSDTVLKIKILDGSRNNGTGSGATNSRIITDTNKMAFTTNTVAGTAGSGNFRLFGQTTTDAFPGAPNTAKADEYIDPTAAYQVPHVENTLCITTTGATGEPGNLFVSFASLNDKFTFTGDSQIAHTGTGNTITLLSCIPSKQTKNDNLEIGAQNKCTFTYEDHTNYCTSTNYKAAVYLASDTTFGELNDLYDIVVQSKTTGIYFSQMFTLKGLTSSETPCVDAGTAVAIAQSDYSSGTSNKKDGADIAYPTSASCSIASKNMIDKVYTYGGAITGIQNYKYLVFDFGKFYYDKTAVVDGTEVTLQVTLNKYPCGQLFTDSIVIGTFVTTCTTASGSTTLLYPYMIGSKYTGWFAGYVITNSSSTAGTATLTAVDDNGNKATFTTPSIPPMGSYNASFLTASDWTQDASNTANFDMTENYVVKVLCNFGGGGGMAFLGNTNEGYAIGYDAYSSVW